MERLSKEQILKADDLPYTDVPVWGGIVRVRTMTARERDEYEGSIYETSGTEIKFNRTDFRAKLVAKCAVDESGKRLFTDADVAALSAKSAKEVSILFDKAQELNGLSKAAQEAIEKK